MLIAIVVSTLMATSIVTVVLAWLAPIIGLISVIWSLFTMINKFRKLAEKLLYVLGALALYGFLTLPYALNPLVHGALVYVLAGGMAITGIGLMSLLLFLYYKIGRQTVLASVYIVGFQWYLVISIIKLLIPGDDDNDPDDDYRDDYHHHHHHHYP